MKTLFGGIVAMASLWAFSAGAGEAPRTGLLPMGPEHREKLERTALKAERARPNELAIQRLNAERAGEGQRPLTEKEVLEEEVSLGSKTFGLLPSSVDNSVLDAFPPIGNQSQQNSCAAWAVGYYQTTFQTALLRGLDAKANSEYRVSPAFVYNHTGFFTEGDGGTAFPDPFVFLLQHGALNILEMPYDYTKYSEWVIDADLWRAAMPNRIASYSQLGRYDMEQFKTHLSNGNLITLGTFWEAAVFDDVANDPGTSEDNAYVGQDVIAYLDLTDTGGHAVCIVGYNDHIWVDINGNSIVDADEKGAFKIANSWGTSWGNSGFVWASYDAFRQISSLPPDDRQPFINQWGGPFILNARAEYEPTMWAEFTVSHDSRDEMQFELGISERTATSYSQSWQPGIVFDQSAWVPIGYPDSTNTGSFAFDVTELWEAFGRPARIWLTAEDTFPDNPMVLSNFRVKDNSGMDVQALSSSYSPSSGIIDNRTGKVYVNTQDDAPVAAADTYYSDKNVTLTVPAPGVLANDTETDGDTLIAEKRSNPSTGSLTWNENGSFTYVPAADQEYVTTFTYRARDLHGDYRGLFSDTVTVTIIVGNIAPTVQILQPAARRDYAEGYPITFSCVADDLNADDTVTVQWTWNDNGTPVVMGTGLEITYAGLPVTGTKPSNSSPITVSATAYDEEKYSTPATIKIDIMPDSSDDFIPDYWAIMYGLDPDADNSELEAETGGTYLDAYLEGRSPIIGGLSTKGCSAGPGSNGWGAVILPAIAAAGIARRMRGQRAGANR